jgi:hypothetical protein
MEGPFQSVYHCIVRVRPCVLDAMPSHQQASVSCIAYCGKRLVSLHLCEVAEWQCRRFGHAANLIHRLQIESRSSYSC